jgi:hypothetical protein
MSASVFQVTDPTQKILRNFAGLSSQLLLLAGQRQYTHLKSKSILAVADLPEAWPKQTGIFDMTRFLGVLSTYPKPSIRLDDDVIRVFESTSPDRFSELTYADPTTIEATPQKEFPHENPAVEFTLAQSDLASLKKNASLMNLQVLTIVVKKGKVTLAAVGETGSANAWKSNIAPEHIVVTDGEFEKTLRFQVEHIILLAEGDYTVRVSDWAYAYFIHKALPLSYYVAQKQKKE